MNRFGPGRVSLFLLQQAEELTRIWRLARATARTAVFPGLLDDVVSRFFSTAAGLLADGIEPEGVWRDLSGLVRWHPELAPGELSAEWLVLGEVLSATCESVNASTEVAAWLERAISACERGTAALDGGRGEAPEGVVTAVIFSSLEPRPSDADRGEST